MSQFYISDDSEADVQRCKESRDSRTVITITGRTTDGFIKAFTGIVQSVEHDAARSPGTRWRVISADFRDETQATRRPADDARIMLWAHVGRMLSTDARATFHLFQ